MGCVGCVGADVILCSVELGSQRLSIILEIIIE